MPNSTFYRDMLKQLPGEPTAEYVFYPDEFKTVVSPLQIYRTELPVVDGDEAKKMVQRVVPCPHCQQTFDRDGNPVTKTNKAHKFTLDGITRAPMVIGYRRCRNCHIEFKVIYCD